MKILEKKARDPYYKFGTFLKKEFGEPVHKLSIHAGFTCPNIDGTLAKGGCTYCYNPSFNRVMGMHPASQLKEQIRSGIQFGKSKKREKFIAYFQSFTNTYDTVDKLKERYDVIYEFDEIVGLSLGTRPDCIDDEKLSLINEYAKTHMVWIEYGLQSIHNRTLDLINRADTKENFYHAIELSKKYPNIFICIHVILGLPEESWEEMMETAEAIAPLPFHGIKIHNIHLVKNTELAKDFLQGKYTPIGFRDYITTCCDFLERIPSSIVVQRLFGDAPSRLLVDPNDWCCNKFAILNAIENEFKRRGSFQGYRVN